MGLKLSKTVPTFLKESPEQKFTAREIAKAIVEKYPVEADKKIKESKFIKTKNQLLTQVVAEIGRARSSFQDKNPEIKITAENIRRYYWTNKSEEDEVQEGFSIDIVYALNNPANEKQGNPQQKKQLSSGNSEKDLYPLLCDYLWSELRIYPLRINEKKSSNKRGEGGNKWLYPDLVAMENLTAGWHDEIKRVVSKRSDRNTRLWSFEAKTRLNGSNVRESFFQAVSNSSWANFGYLVAAQIEGNETIKELRMLSSLHGIGLIQINPENPAESQILIPAEERPEVDWATCNRIAREKNKDFLKFVELVWEFHGDVNLRPSDWDIPDDEDE